MIFYQHTDRVTPDRGFRARADRPLALLRHCPVYEPTRLCCQPDLAAAVGVRKLWVKDESQRMGLGSFKALGGAFAVVQMISDAAGGAGIRTPAARATAAAMTFVTASAGNHGLSLAAGAHLFGASACIVLSASVPESFADRIRRAGGDVYRAGDTYEESVASAEYLARTNGWLLLADGSWPGYTERPALVMEGYTVIAEECRQSFEQENAWPSQVVLQAGVGGMAAALAGHIRDAWAVQPNITVVEPDRAACLQESARAGKLTRATGALSNMGRLDCKDASLLAYESLRGDADTFVSISDHEATIAADRLRVVGHPTTPSGAAGFAALAHLDLSDQDRCLIILSEGPEDLL